MTSPPEQIRRYELSERGAAAESLFRRGWLPGRARAGVVIVHGYAEHSGRYEHVGSWLAERGLATHAYDQLGHGRTSGRRCHVKRFDDYLDDLALVLERVRGDAPELPVFLIGHSMGGLVVATFARERALQVAGVVLSGPALALPGGESRSRMRLARWIRAVWPTLALPAGLDLEGLCSDRAVVEAYLADPLVESRMTAALAAELGSALERSAGRGAEVSLPLLALHGADDTVCRPDGSESFAAAAPHGRFVQYPGLRHEIFNEPSRERVFADMLSWIEEILDELEKR